MDNYNFYKIVLPIAVYSGNKISIKTDFGLNYYEFTKFFDIGEELTIYLPKNYKLLNLNFLFKDKNEILINQFKISLNNNYGENKNNFYRYSND